MWRKRDREWLCGGRLLNIALSRKSALTYAAYLLAEPLAMCGSVGRRRPWSRVAQGDCNHVIARARGEKGRRYPNAQTMSALQNILTTLFRLS